MSNLSDGVTELNLAGLHTLTRAVEHELATAVRRGEPAGSHVKLLAAIESRIARVSDEPAPATVQQRQRVAAGRGSRHPRRAESSH